MYKLVIAALVVVLHVSTSTAQSGQDLVPPSMTAAELWNPFAWYYPYGIAAANAWADYLKNSQLATNQLYQHVHTVSNPPKNTPQKETSKAPTQTSPPSSESGTAEKTTTKPGESSGSG